MHFQGSVAIGLGSRRRRIQLACWILSCTWCALAQAQAHESLSAALGDFVERVQDQIHEAPRLDGCLITEARLVRSQGGQGQYLILSGLIAEGVQRPLVETVANTTLATSEAWRDWQRDSNNHVVVKELQVQPVVPELAEVHFAQGIASFYQEYPGTRAVGAIGRPRPYAEAYHWFALGLRHAPTHPGCAYWKAIIALHQGHPRRAEELLSVYSKRNIRRDQATFKSMERIQGRTRIELEKIIRSAFLSDK